ncbi:hypothetical protein [Anaerobacillus sp. CMMVII]|uniref:hypothetical protein n=1 Tax=Anaerobacillus sp. CMMVII TaxID=2755588 RepID=UPI0021B7E5D9|nr:hypothetical protein [Anaerobacillus sp. CMMVII]
MHSKKTKKGNTTFHFSKQSKGAADIEDIPKGFEIYEEPNGKVYLKKKIKQYIDAKEIEIIQNGIEKYSEIEDFKLDIKKDIVYIYTVDNSFANGLIPKHLLNKYKQYDTQLRFVLIDEDERIFEVERFCYLGSVDDWITLDRSTNLEKLVQDYTHHLGKESFYLF